MTGVFISYRRSDSAGHAGRLADHLSARLGPRTVFIDVGSIEAGAEFTIEIERAIADADAVLVVIGPGWLDASTASGARRLDEPDDHVRREVEAALGSPARVIPVLVGGASMPSEADLPASIAPLARHNALEVLDRRWRDDVDALVDALRRRDRGGRAGNIPVQPTEFVGRDREVSEVTALLRLDDVRLLTLVGPGGVGKTRLAVEVASTLAGDYPGGAWFAGVAALADPELLMGEVAGALGVIDDPGRSTIEAIADRVSRVPTLVVLDNVEQLLPDAAGSIAELSASAPALDLLVSSREPLRVAGEREYPVQPMPGDDALMLFASRARSVLPDFDLDAVREDVEAICARVDRLPLAVELAAARVRSFSVHDLAERLDRRLPLLTGGARDAPARQRTLGATIGWSYDLLTPDERVLFERLSVFAGGWTLEAAESVCDADLDLLESLIDKSLVRFEPGGARRYLMLETIREFAAERLEARGQTAVLRRRHADHVVHLGEDALPDLRGEDQVACLDRLETEHDNIRAALRCLLDTGEPEAALRLAASIWLFWYIRGYVSEGQRWLGEVLSQAPQERSLAQARALVGAGYLAADVDAVAGRRYLEDAVRVARLVDAPGEAAYAASHLTGFVEDVDEGLRLGEEAIALARLSGDRWVLAHALNNHAETIRETGDLPGAARLYEEALSRRNDPFSRALVLSNLGEVSFATGDLERARSLFMEALEITTRAGDTRHRPFALGNLGWVELARGRAREAGAAFLEALTLQRQRGGGHWEVCLLWGLAAVAARDGDPERAARLSAAAEGSSDLLERFPTLVDVGVHLPIIDAARAECEEAAWTRARDEGASMTLEEAVESVLA